MTSLVNTLSRQLYAAQQCFASSFTGTSLLAAWSFMEAICWFILPDYLLLIMVVLCPTKAKRFAIISLVFSMLGCIVMLGLVGCFPEQIGHFIFTLPFTSAGMLTKVHHLEHMYGITATFLQPASAIPAKVWTYAAIYQFHWNLFIFWSFLAIARGSRMAVIAALGWWIGRYLSRKLSGYWLIWLTLYSMLFFLVLAKISR